MMKKLSALLLALLLLCSAALADVLDFGDFNMDLDPEMPGQMFEKADGEVLLQLYPNYSDAEVFHSNINVVWMEEVDDLTAVDPNEFAQVVIDNAVVSLAEAGITATNPVLMLAMHDEHEGVPALSMLYATDCDFSALGVELQTTLYYVQMIVSVEGVGSYTFTITTADFDALDALMEVVNTITWNF